jgi:hypothetical protein
LRPGSSRTAAIKLYSSGSYSETSLANLPTNLQSVASTASPRSDLVTETRATGYNGIECSADCAVADANRRNLGAAPSQELTEGHSNPQTFGRWLSRLRRRHEPKDPQLLVVRESRWVLDDFDPRAVEPQHPVTRRHKKSHSIGSTSLAFVAAVTSATITLASTSVATLSRRKVKWCRGQQHCLSDGESGSRGSVDSSRPVMDGPTRTRYRRRRAKVEELIRTEESYVADIKALSDVVQLMIA